MDSFLHAVSLIVHDHDSDTLHAMTKRFTQGLKDSGLPATPPTLGIAETGYLMMSFITETCPQPDDLLPALAVNLADLMKTGSSVSLTARKRSLPLVEKASSRFFLLNPHQGAPEEWFLLDRAGTDLHARRAFLMPTGPATELDSGEAAIQAQPGWFAAVSFEYGTDDGWDDLTVDLRVRDSDTMAPEACFVEQDYTDWVLSLWEESHVTPDDVHAYPWNFTLTASAAIGSVV